MFDNDPASRKLGIELIELGTGTATMTMSITADMINGHGMTHGGYVFILADTTFAMACNSGDDAAVAARCDIRYLRPTRVGDRLRARAEQRILFGRNGIFDVTVWVGNDVIAEFRGDSRSIGANS